VNNSPVPIACQFVTLHGKNNENRIVGNALRKNWAGSKSRGCIAEDDQAQ